VRVTEIDLWQLWLDCYVVNGLCGLCGQSGIIHTAVKSPVGVPCGGYFFCLCPNGQTMRKQLGMDRPDEETVR